MRSLSLSQVSASLDLVPVDSRTDCQTTSQGLDRALPTIGAKATNAVQRVPRAQVWPRAHASGVCISKRVVHPFPSRIHPTLLLP